MKSDWKQFLMSKGAEFADEQLLSFGNPSRERRIAPQGAILCDLNHQGLISATGNDAKTFLQGQLSNDIEQVTARQAQISAYCNAKGRVLATFNIFQRDGTYYLNLANDLVEPILKRLRMFIMRSQVALSDANSHLVHFGYADPQGEQHLHDIFGQCPSAAYDVLQINELTIIRLPASIARFSIYGELSAARNLWDRLSVHAAAVGASTWDYLDIEAGIPRVSLASSEAWVAQMINLHYINGISFTKGCFSGQEVVARLKYLGKNKRQLYRLEMDSVDIPAIGDFLASSTDQQAGVVLNAVHHPSGKVELLAVIKIAALPALLNDATPALRSLPLPYAVDE